MITHVIDSSVAVEIFARDQVAPELRKLLLTGAAAAPELLDVEAASVLRRMVLRDELAAQEAREALGDIRDSPVLRVPHRPLLTRMWELRENVSAYDACYLVLAESLNVPLATCDARLARSSGHDAEITVYARL